MGRNNAEAEAFERAIAPHTRRLFRAAYRLTGTKTDAEDLFQELLIKLFQQMPQWSAMPQPEPWFMRVVYNLHIDSCRKKARTHGINDKTLHPEPEYLDQLVSTDFPPPDLVEATQRQRRILSALSRLDPDQRALVVLHLMQGHTLIEVAEIMALPLGTLKSRLHRTKAQLKQLLDLEPFSEN
jgi:RNA polymerase sigma-70 factor (ECF subfamily)